MKRLAIKPATQSVIPSVVLSFIISCFVSIGAFATPVNINTADADAMSAALRGVGPKIASKIIEYRKANGDFKSAADLLKVKGIGPSVLERNQDDILTENTSAKSVED